MFDSASPTKMIRKPRYDSAARAVPGRRPCSGGGSGGGSGGASEVEEVFIELDRPVKLSEGGEAGPEVVDEEVGHLEGGEVAAARLFGPVTDVGERVLHPGAYGRHDLLRVHREARRHRHGEARAAGEALPVEAGRRGTVAVD